MVTSSSIVRYISPTIRSLTRSMFFCRNIDHDMDLIYFCVFFPNHREHRKRVFIFDRISTHTIGARELDRKNANSISRYLVT